MYKSRILPASEKDRLVGTEAEKLIPYITDEGPFVLVIELDDMIIGTWVLVPTYHAECVWIHSNYRNVPTIARRLVKGMMQMAHAVGAKNLVTTALNPSIEELVKKLDGKELPGKFFVFPVREY